MGKASFVVSGRRLREQHVALMKIHFIASEKMAAPTNVDLGQALQADFDAISPGVTVDSASVDWSLAVSVGMKDEPQSSAIFYIYIGCAAFAVLGIAGLLVWKLRVRTSNVRTGGGKPLEAEPVKGKPEDIKQAKEVEGVPEDSKKAKEVDAAENCSVSTGPPASDDETHSAENSIPRKSEES